MTARTDDRADVRLSGAGPPLVLLPPLPGWCEAFDRLVPHLAAHRRVLTYDLRERFDGPPRWDALVTEAESLAARHFEGPVAVFGHSFGGALALEWAIRHPERVRALVVSSGFARVFTPGGARFRRFVEQPLALAAMRWLPDPASAACARWLARHRRWVFDAFCGDDIVESVRAGVRRVSVGLVRQRIRLATSLDLRDRLTSVRGPVLLVHGEHDTKFAIAAGDELARAIPHAERRVIGGAGHLHPLSRPDRLAEVLRSWLDQVEGRAALVS